MRRRASWPPSGCGCPRAAALTLDDVDIARRVVHVRHGKGDKSRWARFDLETAKALDRYKRARGRHPHADLDALWLGRVGAFTADGIPLMLKRRVTAAGIPHVWAHRIRDGEVTNGTPMGRGVVADRARHPLVTDICVTHRLWITSSLRCRGTLDRGEIPARNMTAGP